MGSIPVADGGELDLHQSLQREHLKAIATGALVEIRIRGGFMLTHLLACKHDVNCISHRGLRPVQKDIYACSVAVNKARPLQSRASPRQIATLQHHVYIACIADGCFVDRADPYCDRVSARDRIGNPRAFKCRNGS
jgi:hypothetical protein